MELSCLNNLSSNICQKICFEAEFMALDEDGCMSDSIDAKQEPLSRLGLIHPKVIEQHSLSDRHQNPHYRLNQSIENVEAAVSWDELTGRK